MSSSATQESAVVRPRFKLNLWHISLVLVVIGVLISGYLSYAELTDTSTVCIESGAFDCDAVQSSVYSTLMGIKITYLGFATYVGLLVLLLLEPRVGILREYGAMIVFGITLFAFMYSMWLVYVQAVYLQAYCQWCLSHELTMTILFIVSALRLRNVLTAK
jgi:uncharacterized membrane protein